MVTHGLRTPGEEHGLISSPTSKFLGTAGGAYREEEKRTKKVCFQATEMALQWI
jgi:hypothetical protein